MGDLLVAHADWSVDPRKRWIARAVPEGGGWRVEAPCLVGEVGTLLSRLVEEADGAPVALGVDFPLGLPRAYAAPLSDTDFPAFLRRIGTVPGFFEVAACLADVGTDRPFYPARGARGMTRAAHATALGLGDATGLSRACDRATAERPAGAPLFWTLGANQTGKAAIIAWRDMLAGAGPAVRLWPFAGAFRSLLAPGAIVLAETYPAEAMRHLGVRLAGSKRRQCDRAAAGPMLEAAMAGLGVAASPALAAALRDGFGADAAGEDRFDCVLGALCVLNVLAGRRPDTAPDDPWILRWEGWVLGQTALPRMPFPTIAPPARSCRRRSAM